MSEKIEYPIVNQNGGSSGVVMLDSSVFNNVRAERVVHETIVWQRNKKRAGTHSTLNKAVMEVSGKKPWKQKGTGKARSGGADSPIWVGGAVAHGPKPRDYTTRINKREKTLALTSVLGQKKNANELMIVDSLDVKEGKTKEFQNILQSLNVAGSKCLLILTDINENLTARAARNINTVNVITVEAVNVYDLVNAKYVLTTPECINSLQKRILATINRG